MTCSSLLLTALPLAAGDGHWLGQWIDAFTNLFPSASFFSFSFNVRALIALILVSLSCGSVGSLVVGSRMAFFSDALAHCAFAGVSLGFLVFTGLLARVRPTGEFWDWVLPIMIVYGILVAYGIARVRNRTGLASDTVIGVFFAGNIGLAAMLRRIIQDRRFFSLEDFLFGDPLKVSNADLVNLALLAVVTAVVLYGTYNYLLLAGFNSSLALSRRVPVRLTNYLFVMLLALIVNVSLLCVGVLLINALLIVPAATAVNVSRNMRQLFWLSIGCCLVFCVLGLYVYWECFARWRIDFGIPGTIILLSVAGFVLSMFLGPWVRRQPAAR
jgi:zinc transport system permease protein